MHQQVRTSIRRIRSDGTTEAPEAESLVAILTLLKGKNLQSAGRVKLDTGDEQFVFSVQHAAGDNSADQDACDILNGADFEAAIYPIKAILLGHRPGELLNRIDRLERSKREPVIEVHVLAAEPDGRVPVQLVTRSMLNR